jgi:hypothetical protein
LIRRTQAGHVRSVQQSMPLPVLRVRYSFAARVAM